MALRSPAALAVLIALFIIALIRPAPAVAALDPALPTVSLSLQPAVRDGNPVPGASGTCFGWYRTVPTVSLSAAGDPAIEYKYSTDAAWTAYAGPFKARQTDRAGAYFAKLYCRSVIAAAGGAGTWSYSNSAYVYVDSLKPSINVASWAPAKPVSGQAVRLHIIVTDRYSRAKDRFIAGLQVLNSAGTRVYAASRLTSAGYSGDYIYLPAGTFARGGNHYLKLYAKDPAGNRSDLCVRKLYVTQATGFLKVTNDTKYSLSITYTGLKTGSFAMGAYTARTVTLPTGTYRVTARTSSGLSTSQTVTIYRGETRFWRLYQP